MTPTTPTPRPLPTNRTTEVEDLRAEVDRLQADLAHARARIEKLTGNFQAVTDLSENYLAELEGLREHIALGQAAVEAMDKRMPEQTTEDAEGWITSYRIPVGPWHRLLAWARSQSTGHGELAAAVEQQGAELAALRAVVEAARAAAAVNYGDPWALRPRWEAMNRLVAALRALDQAPRQEGEL